MMSDGELFALIMFLGAVIGVVAGGAWMEDRTDDRWIKDAIMHDVGEWDENGAFQWKTQTGSSER